MRKVRVLVDFDAEGQARRAGEIIDLPDIIADGLISSGKAEAVRVLDAQPLNVRTTITGGPKP